MTRLFFKLRCPNCGQTINELDNICPHCGTNLDETLKPEELEALARPHFEKAQHLLDAAKNLDEALRECDKTIGYVPDSAKAHNLRGLILNGLGRSADAILAYQEALRLEPDFAEAKEYLAEAMVEYKNNPYKASTLSAPTKPQLNTGQAMILGVLTMWPIIYLILFITFIMSTFFSMNIEHNAVNSFFGVIYILHLLTMLISLGILIYYIYHIYSIAQMTTNSKIIWTVIFLMVGMIAFPVYWYLYVWKPARSYL